jgi:hypothetical protein
MSKISQTENPVYAKSTIDFVTVSKTFCDLMDQLESINKDLFVDSMLRLLPLIYLKAGLLPENELISDDDQETFATEEQYSDLSQTILNLMGTDNAYLEVFSPEISYSDTPVTSFISENIADIWQDLFNFISVYHLENDETMNDALFVCHTNFKQFWGQSLVNVLRALHSCKYSISEKEEGKEEF